MIFSDAELLWFSFCLFDLISLIFATTESGGGGGGAGGVKGMSTSSVHRDIASIFGLGA